MSTIKLQTKIPRILLILVFAIVILGIVTNPALAQNNSSIKLCDSATETANTVQNIFLIMSVLGPVFATLFFVGMSVADAATVQEKYNEQRRKVLLLGFGVPVAISFLGAIANTLLDQSVDCFFP